MNKVHTDIELACFWEQNEHLCGSAYTRLIVVLQGHGDDVDADDEGDDEVQVVVGAQCVDHQAYVAIAGKVG